MIKIDVGFAIFWFSVWFMMIKIDVGIAII